MQEEGTRFYTVDNGATRGPFSTFDEVIMSASDRTKTGKPLAYRFFCYGSIPYHTPYGEIYYGTIGTYTIPSTLESRKPPFDDPEDDLFDKDYDSVRAEPHLDIVSVNIWRSGTDTFMELTLKGPVPQRIDSTIFIQWGIYIDVDCNPNTGESSHLLRNDLGVDYHIRLTMLDSTFYSQIRTMPQRKDMGKPRYSIKDNKITFIIGPQELQLPASPIFVMATAEKWSNRGNMPTVLLAADKAPNFGHYTISAVD